MEQPTNLEQHLTTALSGQSRMESVAKTINCLADAALEVSERVTRGPLAGNMSAICGTNTDGDNQKVLDVLTNKIFSRALEGAPVSILGSEEVEEAVVLDADAPLVVAMDPLDGSSNIQTNVTIGTIFSIYERQNRVDENPEKELLQPGKQQLAAGFFIYGPYTALVLTVGHGTDIYVLDQNLKTFQLITSNVQIQTGTKEYAVNASNYDNWDMPVRAFIDDCVAGSHGPCGADYNMRWVASLVADAYRILIRGGIYLYPADSRPGYGEGRLRLVYEANPIAFLVEQAGGKATDGVIPILGITPISLHQRIPLVFGSPEIVDRLTEFHTTPAILEETSPLFGKQNLFRA
jgi:fructose-1,6-bisphosphatase I